MQRYTSVQNNITAFLLGISFLFIAGIGGYFAGYEIYWTHYTVFEWYRNFLVGIIPLLDLVLTWWFGYTARFSPRIARSMLYFYGIIASLVCTLIYIMWEIVNVKECNKINGSDFVHPHCANPNYPVETLPKTEWFLTFVGAIICGVAQVICLLFSEQITCIGARAGAIAQPAYSEGGFYRDTMPAASQFGAHYGKHVGHPSHSIRNDLDRRMPTMEEEALANKKLF